MCEHAATPDCHALALPLNHCNLPGWLIASLTFQQHPVALEIDGIALHHADLFTRLQQQEDARSRAQLFTNYMAVHFRLPDHELAPWPEAEPIPRPNMNYRRLLIGWLFDSDSDAGAAWRGWAESRFGLRTRYHKAPIADDEAMAAWQFRQAWVRATYHTHDLARQLDLLYSYCQFELACRYPHHTHLQLYRGSHQPFPRAAQEPVMAFNNLSSFTQQIDEAYRFGAHVCVVQVPLSKIVCFDSLLPGTLDGESEFMVLGGWYRVRRAR